MNERSARLLMVLAIAASGCTYDPPVGLEPDGPGPAPDTIVLSQNLSPVPASGDGVFCNDAALGRDNAWYRRFVAGDFGITDAAFSITSVHFTAELALGSPRVTVEIYDYAGTANEPTLSALAVRMATATLVAPDSDIPQDLVVPIAATVSAPQAFIVRISSTDTEDIQGDPIQQFHLGANAAGETAHGYWSSVTCDAETPTSQIDHIIIEVEGVEIAP